MTEKIGIGIIGGGFVGSAVARVFQHYADVKLFDLDPARSANSFSDTVKQDIIYVCLPTPMAKDGSVDTGIVRQTLLEIAQNMFTWRPTILKSTLPPQALREIAAEHQDTLALIFNPEFLTERTAEYDLQQSTRFIFGVGHEALQNHNYAVQLVDELYSQRFPAVPRYWVSLETASLVKYFTNVFFANKVSIMNEFYQVATALDTDPQEVVSLMMLDPRIGRSHFQVPGHDGSYGYGGSCFLKDINGYKQLAKEAGCRPTMAQAGWLKNIESRGSKTLVKELKGMFGRAASATFTEGDLRNL